MPISPTWEETTGAPTWSDTTVPETKPAATALISGDEVPPPEDQAILNQEEQDRQRAQLINLQNQEAASNIAGQEQFFKTPMVNVPPKAVRTASEFLFPASRLITPTKFGQGVTESAAEQLSGMTAPLTAASMLPLAIPVVGEGLGLGMAAEGLTKGGTHLADAFKSGDSKEIGKALTEMAGTSTMLIPAAHGAIQRLKPAAEPGMPRPFPAEASPPPMPEGVMPPEVPVQPVEVKPKTAPAPEAQAKLQNQIEAEEPGLTAAPEPTPEPIPPTAPAETEKVIVEPLREGQELKLSIAESQDYQYWIKQGHTPEAALEMTLMSSGRAQTPIKPQMIGKPPDLFPKKTIPPTTPTEVQKGVEKAIEPQPGDMSEYEQGLRQSLASVDQPNREMMEKNPAGFIQEELTRLDRKKSILQELERLPRTLEDTKNLSRQQMEQLLREGKVTDTLFYQYAKEWNKTPRFGNLMQEGPIRESAIVPEVQSAAVEWAKAEKRLRRALRQEPSDVDAAREARDNAELDFRSLAWKNKISQQQFDELVSVAKATDTANMPEPSAEPRPAVAVESAETGKEVLTRQSEGEKTSHDITGTIKTETGAPPSGSITRQASGPDIGLPNERVGEISTRNIERPREASGIASSKESMVGGAREEVSVPAIIEGINKRDKRDWSKLPASFELDAVKAAFNDIKEFFPKQAISQRVRASKATTFPELREAVQSALEKYRPDLSKPTPAEPTPAATEGKAPWQMTQKEYAKFYNETPSERERVGNFPNLAHKQAVREAIRAGDIFEHPDYPDLTPSKQLTPLQKQWRAIKDQHPNEVVLVRLGDFYEAFYDDAKILSKDANVVMTRRNEVPMAGIPYHAAERYVDALKKAGNKVHLVEDYRAELAKPATEPTPPPAATGAAKVGPGFGGPGAAAVESEFPSPPRAKAAAAAVEGAAPPDKPIAPQPPISTFLSHTVQALRDAKSELNLMLKGVAGQSMPRTTAADMSAGEAGVRYASSRIAARPLAQTFSAHSLEGTGVDPVKFGAALTEDNLRSVREHFRNEGTRLQTEGKVEQSDLANAAADKVSTIVGAEKSPFKTEDDFQDYLARPDVKKAIAQHIQQWQEVVEPMYKSAMSIDPDVELPTRGLQTGARVNLKAILEGDESATPIKGTGFPSLTATFKRKSPFGVKVKGTGETYETNYHEIIANTFERQLEIANKNAFDKILVETGLAEIHKPGWRGEINGESVVAFPLKRGSRIITTKEGETIPLSNAINLYVKKSIAGEYRRASNVDARFKIPLVTSTMNLLNKAALAGLTDFTVHTSNLMTALFNRPVSGKLWSDTFLSAMGRADVPIVLAKAISKAARNNQAQIAQLSEIGAMREGSKSNIAGKILKSIDRTTRLVLDDTYQQLSKEGLVEGTETARREYVNQVGQYNRRLQGPLTQFFRDTGFGPFITAGKTFNALGVRMATLDPGVSASNNFAAASLRANALSKWIGAAVLVGTMNYLLTKDKGGGVMGRPGTPIGKIDTGLNDKNNKPLQFPLFDVIGLGRGMRVTGIRGFEESKRLGLTTPNAIDAAARDIFNSWTAPAAGPPIKFGFVAGTGFQPAYAVGRASPVAKPGESQARQNIQEAVKEANPVAQSIADVVEGKSLPEALSRQLPRFTMTPGKPPEMVEKYPHIVGLAQTHAYADYVVGKARKLEPTLRRKFINDSLQGLTPEQQKMVRDTLQRRKITW